MLEKSLHAFLVPLVALAITFGSQLYFLNADPHPGISTSRGPFTDEGLNTCQARNFVNQGDWGLAKCDNLVKSPLYNGYLATIFTVFNTQRKTARLAVLLLSLFLWLVFLLRSENFLGSSLFLLLAGFQFHLFQFLHFSMVEAVVCFLIPLALLSGARYLANSGTSFKPLLYCFLFAYAGFLLKIQYAYLLALPFGVWFIPAFTGGKIKVKYLVFLLSLILGGALLFYLAWFLPTEAIFLEVWQHQGTHRFPAFNDLWLNFTNAGKYLLWNSYNFWFAISFLASIPLGIFAILKSRPGLQKYLLILGGAWVLLETHKAFILFLPTRYTLALFAAQAFWMAMTFGTYLKLLWENSSSGYRIPVKALPLLFIVPVLVQHFSNFRELHRTRSFESQKIIDRFDILDFKGRTVGGVWATSLIWNPTAEVIPVWKNFLNDSHFIRHYDPPLVVTEKGEADSEQVFLSRGIVLSERAFHTETYRYGPYQIGFYQLKALDPRVKQN